MGYFGFGGERLMSQRLGMVLCLILFVMCISKVKNKAVFAWAGCWNSLNTWGFEGSGS